MWKLRDSRKINFSKTHPWISATTDGYIIFDNTPIEIKTANKGNVDQLLRKHYHQLNYTMHCAASNYIIVIVYIFENEFRILRVEKDKKFISRTIRHLERTYIRYFYDFTSESFKIPTNEDDDELSPDSLYHLLKPLKKERFNKYDLRYEDITKSFISKITLEDFNSGKSKTITEYEQEEKNTLNILAENSVISKKVMKEVPHRKEVHLFIEFVMMKYYGKVTKLEDL